MFGVFGSSNFENGGGDIEMDLLAMAFSDTERISNVELK